MPEGELRNDKRKHLRVGRKFTVLYKVMNNWEAEEIPVQLPKKDAQTGDISISGIQLICEEVIEKDAMIRIDILMEGDSEPLSTFAEVRWVQYDLELKKYRLGLQFLVLKQEHLNMIKKITGE